MKRICKAVGVLVLITALVAIPLLNGGVATKRSAQVMTKNNSDKPKKRVSKIRKMKSENSDYIGHISIPKTGVNYPVMQTKDNPDFYLNHGFDKQYDFKGTPYLSAYCDLKSSDNLIIYGHNINGGRMFGELTKYRDKSFYENHKYLYFETEQKKLYEIFAVISVDVNAFTYWKFVMAIDEADFNKFVSEVKERSIYKTEIEPKYGEQLLTLSTCDNGRGNNYRFVVFAKPIIDD